MKSARNIVIVLVTAPNLPVARKIAKAALKAKLAACANIVPRIESHYWWKGKLEASAEVLIIFKGTKAKLAALESTVVANHPYETPEVISFALDRGNAKYLKWLTDIVR